MPFENVDLIMGPTCPSPAFKFGSKGDDPVAMYLEDIYTIATNLAGLPGMSIPCGMVEDKPVGLQIIGNYFDEARHLKCRPPVSAEPATGTHRLRRVSHELGYSDRARDSCAASH